MGQTRGCECHRPCRGAARCEIQQCLGRLCRKVIGEVQQGFLGCLLHIVQPLAGNAAAKQFVVPDVVEDSTSVIRDFAGDGLDFDVPRHLDFEHLLADLDDLRRPGSRMLLETPSLGPAICGVVMADVAEQKVRTGLVDDQAEVAADSHRPEIPVLRAVNPVKPHPRLCRVHLQLECGDLGRLLLLARESPETGGEGVGDAEFHYKSQMQPAEPFNVLRHSGARSGSTSGWTPATAIELWTFRQRSCAPRALSEHPPPEPAGVHG